MVRTHTDRTTLSAVESLEALADGMNELSGVNATFHAADEGDLPGGNDTVTVEVEPTVDLDAVLTPVRNGPLYVFATEYHDDGTGEATINDPDDLEWL